MTGYCTLHLSGELLEAVRAALELARRKAANAHTRATMGKALAYLDGRVAHGLDRAEKVRARNRDAKRRQLERERALAEGRPVIPRLRPGRPPRGEVA